MKSFFRKSKKLNLIYIGLIPFIFILQIFLNNWTLKTENLIYWAIAVNMFGVLEHINYYNRQLMIDNSSDINYVIKNRKAMPDESQLQNIVDEIAELIDRTIYRLGLQ